MLKTMIRRRVVALLAGVTLLAATACGSSAATTTTKPGEGPGNSVVAKGGAGFATADEETARLGSDAAAGVFPRTVRHANGTTEIKAKPTRVVALDTGEMDSLVALGIKPVGIVVTKGANPVPSYLAEALAGVPSVGDINTLNLEAIAALQPDLIVSSKLRHDKLYDQLSQIAPTVFEIRAGFPWKENFRLIADAVGEETKADEVMQDYSRRADAVRQELGGRDTTVSMVRFMPGKLRLYATKSLVGVVLRDAGMKRPAQQDVDDLAVEISPENISQADGGLLLYSSYGDPAATGETATTTGETWKSIPAVSQGRAHRVSDDVWFLGLGPVGAQIILDELAGFLR